MKTNCLHHRTISNSHQTYLQSPWTGKSRKDSKSVHREKQKGLKVREQGKAERIESPWTGKSRKDWKSVNREKQKRRESEREEHALNRLTKGNNYDFTTLIILFTSFLLYFLPSRFSQLHFIPNVSNPQKWAIIRETRMRFNGALKKDVWTQCFLLTRADYNNWKLQSLLSIDLGNPWN